MLTTAGTPRETIAALNTALNRALGNTDVRQKLAAQGFEASGGTTEDWLRCLQPKRSASRN